ncbi:neurogenic locus notch homolog protein 1-like isoform X2 [Nematostella vectensis]|uniref:neurogenic locus notch homolog protein 1-like isoform X2 n=1 Tax=Nematostella vectensis TaxID=45351 RepID=UPI002076DA26|nr:neurogenic locus notch homolog protein 1-like isoform X2 [Nematostella vectensis]
MTGLFLVAILVIVTTFKGCQINGEKTRPFSSIRSFQLHEKSYLSVTHKKVYFVERLSKCVLNCLRGGSARSFNLTIERNADGKYLCEVLFSDRFLEREKYVASQTFDHYESPSECSKWPCRHGKCKEIYELNDYECVCEQGYTGKHCETDIDECKNKPCQNGGICKNLPGKYECACPSGTTGKHCETFLPGLLRIGEEPVCSRNDSYIVQFVQSYQTSHVTYYTYGCGTWSLSRCTGSRTYYGTAYRTLYRINIVTKVFCCPGWKQHNTSCPNDIDECAGNPCLNDGNCTDHANNYSCKCQPGFTGINCEKAPRSCASIRALDFTFSGVYRIRTPNGSGALSDVYCEMTKMDGGWTMVFKAVSGASPLTASALWASDVTRDMDSNVFSVMKTNTSHYKSIIVEEWDAFGPSEVLVNAYVEGVSVLHMIFNAKKSDKMSWMQKSRVLSSSWTDPALSVAILEFTLKGICPDYPGVCQQFDVLQSGRGGCNLTADQPVVDVMTVHLR